MKEWPTAADFWAALDAPEGKVGMYVFARECQRTTEMKSAIRHRAKAALGAGWRELDVRQQAALGREGYEVDSAFVRSVSGTLARAPVISVRVARDVVGREAFLRSMNDADPRELCARGVSMVRDVKAVFDSAGLTYWCEYTADVRDLGQVRSVYVWQFHDSRLVICDAMIPGGDAAILGELKRALRAVIATLRRGALTGQPSR
jgi:hypothetical protein